MKNISDRMISLLERLAEMFPRQHYQSELDQFISNRHPQHPADVEQFTKEYEQRTMRKFI